MRDEFPKPIKDALAKRVANRCSNPDCGRTTSGPHSIPSKAVSVGVAAHITAAALGGPRYDAELTAEQRASAENGIWLCAACATLIDRDEKRYPKKRVREWKNLAEMRTREQIERRQSASAAEAGLDPAVARGRDVRQLSEILHCIDCTEFDRFLEGLSMRTVTRGIWDYFYSFDGTVSSSLFHVYDEDLRHAITELHEAWHASLGFGEWFTLMPDGQTFRFMRSHEGNDPRKWPEALAAFEATVPRIEAAYGQLLDYVRTCYPEIDLAETSAVARRLAREWEERARRLMDF